MTKFKEVQKIILTKAKAKNACSSGYNQAQNAKDLKALMKVVYDYLNWCYSNGVINYDFMIKSFGEKLMKEYGLLNTGENNTGFKNAGNRNAGYANAGNRNAGNRNAGNYNAGNYNAGNRNAGYANAGNDNAGNFNTTQAPYIMFNKPSKWTYEDFRNSRAFQLLNSIETTIYVPSSIMTDEEKKAHPYHITTGSYIKYIPFKEAFASKWNNWDKESHEAFISLPNFDKKVFEEITSVKIK